MRCCYPGRFVNILSGFSATFPADEQKSGPVWCICQQHRMSLGTRNAFHNKPCQTCGINNEYDKCVAYTWCERSSSCTWNVNLNGGCPVQMSSDADKIVKRFCSGGALPPNPRSQDSGAYSMHFFVGVGSDLLLLVDGTPNVWYQNTLKDPKNQLKCQHLLCERWIGLSYIHYVIRTVKPGIYYT